jgi:hypothetical protein
VPLLLPVTLEAQMIETAGLSSSSRSGSIRQPEFTCKNLKILRYLSDQPLKGKFAYQQFCAFLILPNLTQSHGPWPESMRFFDSLIKNHFSFVEGQRYFD